MTRVLCACALVFVGWYQSEVLAHVAEGLLCTAAGAIVAALKWS